MRTFLLTVHNGSAQTQHDQAREVHMIPQNELGPHLLKIERRHTHAI